MTAIVIARYIGVCIGYIIKALSSLLLAAFARMQKTNVVIRKNALIGITMKAN